MESSTIGYATCEVLTCCGTIMDCKDNFKARDNNKTAAWMTGIIRMVFWIVGIFNVVMDGFFIHKLFTAPDISNRYHYAYLMLSVTVLSFISEHFAFSPVINVLIKNVENWHDRLNISTVCCFSSLVSFWLEDFTTIFLYFKIDGVYDTDDLADVLNLFSSVSAGCLSVVFIIILNILYIAAYTGSFSSEVNRSERWSNCKYCLLEVRWCNWSALFWIFSILINGATTYIAVRSIYLKDLDLKSIARDEYFQVPYFIILYMVIFFGAMFFLFFFRLRTLLFRSDNKFWDMFHQITPELHGITGGPEMMERD